MFRTDKTKKRWETKTRKFFFVTFRVFRRMKCKFSVKSHLNPTCVKSYPIFALFLYRFLVQTDTKFRNVHPPSVFAFCRESEFFCNWNWLCLRDVIFILRTVKTRRKKISFMHLNHMTTKCVANWFFCFVDFGFLGHFYHYYDICMEQLFKPHV